LNITEADLLRTNNGIDLAASNLGQRFLLACAWRVCHLAGMPYRPQRSKKPKLKPGELENRQFHSDQLSDQRRREMATRSTLARLRNRKSDLK
jgi:hypothetical protein